MLIWKIFGTLFIISVVVAAICAVCKLVVSLETLNDRTNDHRERLDELVKFAMRTDKKVDELNDYQNVTDQTVSEDRAEISALHDHFDDLKEKIKANSVRISALTDLYEDLLKRIESLEKGGAQIERKTGRTGKEG